MNSTEKQVSYTTTNSYSTLNDLHSPQENIWFVCHGLGYLSRYFLRYFVGLDKEKNYIIAPQAPAKYYQKTDFKHVGASWLTKENTKTEIQNVLAYLDEVYKTEVNHANPKKVIFMGYSQGVSVITRWMVARKISCDALIIHSGGIPTELTAEDFAYLAQDTKVKLLYGLQDEYLTPERIKGQQKQAKNLFGKRLEIIPFEGKHIVNRGLLEEISENL